MSCSCLPKNRKNWVVTDAYSNRSKFSRGGSGRSAYSGIRCLLCGNFWRTKASYVGTLMMATRAECLAAYPQPREATP